MTDQDPTESTPGTDPFGATPDPAADAAPAGEGGANARAREWLAQLEAMIQDVATQAAPVARQVAAKAAELTAVAAVKAGPLAQKAAVATSDVGQKLAERAQNLASELRGEHAGTPTEDVAWGTTDATDATSTGTTTDEHPDGNQV